METLLPSMKISPSNCENNIAIDRDVHICYSFRKERLVNRLVLFRVGKGMSGVVLFIFTADKEVSVFLCSVGSFVEEIANVSLHTICEYGY